MLLLSQTRIFYQWSRLEQLDQWWHWLILALVVAAITAFVVYWYRRDSVEHPRPVGWALLLLRMAALSGILLYFFQLDRRTEQRVVRDSKVAILVDTSLSMSLPGTPSQTGVASSLSRSDEALRLIGQSDLLQQLSAKHQLSVYRFDSTPRPIPIAALNKSLPSDDAVEQESAADQQSLSTARRILLLAGLLGLIALLSLCIALAAQIAGDRNWPTGNWLLLLGACWPSPRWLPPLLRLFPPRVIPWQQSLAPS